MIQTPEAKHEILAKEIEKANGMIVRYGLQEEFEAALQPETLEFSLYNKKTNEYMKPCDAVKCGKDILKTRNLTW